MASTDRIPAALGYRMPAEWEPHQATWLAWPHIRETWPQLEPVQALYARLIAALQPHEQVHLLVNDADMAAEATQNLRRQGVSTHNLYLHECPTVDAWLRDSGPTFLTPSPGTRQPLLALDWRFNAWGQKYPEMLADDAVARCIADRLGLPRVQPGIVLEGGSIDVNGQGSVLTTEQCLLHPNRNASLRRADVERYLHDYLGTRHVIWLGDGIAGDDTDGHVDDIARFVDPTTVVCALSPDPQDVNFPILQDNYRRLQTAADSQGRPLRVVPLPMPDPVWAGDERLPASYANFYLANGVVLVPTYGCPQDGTALAVLRDLFPDRQVLGLDCEPLVWGLGAIHCVTQQQPAGPPA